MPRLVAYLLIYAYPSRGKATTRPQLATTHRIFTEVAKSRQNKSDDSSLLMSGLRSRRLCIRCSSRVFDGYFFGATIIVVVIFFIISQFFLSFNYSFLSLFVISSSLRAFIVTFNFIAIYIYVSLQ